MYIVTFFIFIPISDAEFVDKHRATLIKKVASVMEIADTLLAKLIITHEMYDDIYEAATPQEKMRKLYKFLDSQGSQAKAEFYEALMETHHGLVEELASTLS